jgi:hypothetical protein
MGHATHNIVVFEDGDIFCGTVEVHLLIASLVEVKAKETKRCHHCDDDDLVEFCQL